MVNRQSGTYLKQTSSKYSDISQMCDNTTTENRHIHPAINAQEIDMNEKSPLHSFPTLTLYHTERSDSVHVQSDVTKDQNFERSSPASTLPFKRDSPDLAFEISKQNTLNKDHEDTGVLEVSSVSKGAEGEEIPGVQNESDMDTATSQRKGKGKEEMRSSDQENSGGDQEDLQEFYHGNQQGFQDNILAPHLDISEISNSLHQDNDEGYRRPSYTYGKFIK